MTSDVRLDDLMDELRRGKVWECALRDPTMTWQFHGLQEGEAIYIDPRPAVLETLLHELIHRRKPRWGERRVELTARRMVAKMDDRTKAQWWRAYTRTKRRGRPIEVDE